MMYSFGAFIYSMEVEKGRFSSILLVMGACLLMVYCCLCLNEVMNLAVRVSSFGLLAWFTLVLLELMSHS